MPSGVVKAVQDRPLTIHAVGAFAAGGTSVTFRAAVKRSNHLWSVLVKCVSKDRTRVFVKFDNGNTAWISVDELLEG